jgi:hypothetical protein
MIFIIMDITFFVEIRVLYKYFYPSIRSIRNNIYIYSVWFASSKFYLWLFYKYIYIIFFDGYADRRIEKPGTASFLNKNSLSESSFLAQKTDSYTRKSIPRTILLLIFERSVSQ